MTITLKRSQSQPVAEVKKVINLLGDRNRQWWTVIGECNDTWVIPPWPCCCGQWSPSYWHGHPNTHCHHCHQSVRMTVGQDLPWSAPRRRRPRWCWDISLLSLDPWTIDRLVAIGIKWYHRAFLYIVLVSKGIKYWYQGVSNSGIKGIHGIKWYWVMYYWQFGCTMSLCMTDDWCPQLKCFMTHIKFLSYNKAYWLRPSHH